MSDADRRIAAPRAPTSHATIGRRSLIAGGLAATLLVRPARATPERMAAAIRDFTGGRAVELGRVRLEMPALVENGNAVPVTVSVDSPMTTADHVTTIALFNERNPLPDVARFHLGPRAGEAWVSTRIRLGDSQTIVAIARLNDGSLWSARAELIVTLPACIEP
ncbi:MAG: SoxY-related AACIE arm protein [Alphaproteobacteria bacterium]|nr:SoxY-related AACIE arm protein [Alphaproteobacteria bacterium]